MAEEKETARDELGRFVPGSSGNYHGRPKGTMNFTTMIVDALANEVETGPGTSIELKEYLAQVLVGILVNGTYRTLDGAEIKISGRELLPFFLSVWKKIDPSVTALDITSGGEKLDFGKLNNAELIILIEDAIGDIGEGSDGSEEEGSSGSDL